MDSPLRKLIESGVVIEMYGVVNQAVENFVKAKSGLQAWSEIQKTVKMSENFVTMNYYSDEVTFSLVQAASRELKIPEDELLFQFGQFWVQSVAAVTYQHFMEASESNFAKFVKNLDQLHSRIKVSFPKLNPPSFHCEEKDSETLLVSYFSERSGLTRFVEGIFVGLGDYFDEKVNVEVVGKKENGVEYDRFRITHRQQRHSDEKQTRPSSH